MKVALAVAALATTVFLAGFDGSPPGTRHWIAYATERTSRKTIWLFPFENFESADDCDHTVRHHVDSRQDGGLYDYPLGCVYASNARYWTWIVNKLFQTVG